MTKFQFLNRTAITDYKKWLQIPICGGQSGIGKTAFVREAVANWFHNAGLLYFAESGNDS